MRRSCCIIKEVFNESVMNEEDRKEAGPSTSGEAADKGGPNCLFKRMKRGGGGNVGASNRRRPMQKASSSSSSSDSDEKSDTEIYKKPKKSRIGLVQSSSAFNAGKSKKKRWQKHIDGQNTSSDSADGDDDAASDVGVKFRGSGAQTSNPSDMGATATLEIDTAFDKVSLMKHSII